MSSRPYTRSAIFLNYPFYKCRNYCKFLLEVKQIKMQRDLNQLILEGLYLSLVLIKQRTLFNFSSILFSEGNKFLLRVRKNWLKMFFRCRKQNQKLLCKSFLSKKHIHLNKKAFCSDYLENVAELCIFLSFVFHAKPGITKNHFRQVK